MRLEKGMVGSSWKKLARWAGLAVALVAVPALAGLPPSHFTPEQIVHKSDYILRGKTTAAVVEMSIHTKSYNRDYDMVFWEDNRSDVGKVLVKVLGPALWRGNGTLKVGRSLSLYNPSTDRVTALSASMLGGSWMGSHFSNDDLVKLTDLANDYNIKLTKSWEATGPDGKQVLFHELLLNPKPSAPVSWDHIILTAYEEGMEVQPTKLDYYRRAGSGVTRTLSFTDLREFSGRRVPAILTMTVADKPGEYTKIIYQTVKFDMELSSDKFTERALRQ